MAVLSMFKYVYQNRIGNKISLEDLSYRYKREHNRTPIVVVNGLHVLERCFENLDQGVYGGQWSEYLQRTRTLVEKIKAVDIEFVFYFDGSPRAFSKHEIELRKEHQSSKIISSFHKVKDYNNKQGTHDRLPPGIPSFMRYILKYEFGCIVRSSLINLTQEIARFAATTDHCIGILANDADYIIFETKPLLSAKSLDIENMTTDIFHPSKFIEATGLTDRQLPLLSCMAGNHLISADELKTFHNKLSPDYGSKDHYHINNIISYIRHRRWTGDKKELSKIASTLQMTKEKLNVGMSYYDLTMANNAEYDRFPSVKEKCADCSIPAPLYTLLHLRKYTEGSSMEDPDDTQLPPSSSVFKPIRQRMYYVLQDGKSEEIEESSVCKTTAYIKTENVRSLPLDISGEEIPPIEQLLLGVVDQEIRWKLFTACMGLTIPISRLKVIEPRLVAMCSLLNFLVQNEEIGLEDWEVKSFIYQAIYPRTVNISKLRIINTTTRAMSLGGMFLRGVTTIIKVIPVCGFPVPFVEAMPWKYLEGEVFHYAYNLLKNSPNKDDVIKKLCWNDEKFANQLFEIYQLTVTGTRLEE